MSKKKDKDVEETEGQEKAKGGGSKKKLIVMVLVPVVWAVVDCLILRIPITSIKIKVLMRYIRCSFPVNGHS